MTIAPSFESDGYWLTPVLVGMERLDGLRDAADRVFASAGGARAGLRDALSRHEAFRDAIGSAKIRELARSILGPEAFVVRSILFDKTPDANWDVVWHQDVTIAVTGRADVEGFGPWSMKAGVHHVQPPAHVLQSMVTIRLHLDDCGPANGPLLVVPGSHRQGVVDVRTLDVTACDAASVRCCVDAGAAVVMRPLTLHASRKSTSPSHRRVLHVEYAAAAPLPHPLEWARL